MRMIRVCLMLSLVICLCGMVASAVAYGRIETGKVTTDYKSAPDRILVKYNRGTAENARQRISTKFGSRFIEKIPELDIHVVEVPNGKLTDTLKRYRQEESVAYAEPDFVAKAFEVPYGKLIDALKRRRQVGFVTNTKPDSAANASGVPSDPYFSKQWAMSKDEVLKAWGITHGKSSTRIAILDSGIDKDHQDLAKKIVARKNFSSSRTFDDRYGHGTHVAGTAAAATNNGIGVAGVGYDCSLMNVKVLNDRGAGYSSWIAKGIIWAADNGAKVINISLGQTEPSSVLEDAVNYAWNKGVVLVAAAGNDGLSTKHYPAAYANCIAVTATDSTDNKAVYSTYGDWVDLAAPGVEILSTLPNHRHAISSYHNYGYLTGTSMAAPFVAGLAGLMWSTDYGVSNATVRSRIEEAADRTTNGNIYSNYGVPCVNYYKSVAN